MAETTSKTSRQARLEEASPVRVGETIADKYRITELLAVGGMGLVAKAQHEVLDHPVAVKFLLPGVEAPGAATRFLREARAAAKIQSEHVVRVFDCGTMDSGVPYMVMEYLEGQSLAQVMRRERRMSIQDAVDLLMQALEGVAEAHARDIVHRDLKPSNLFLVGEPPRRTVKVLDFGISKIPVGADTPVGEEDLTHTSMILGSPKYISPEQARNSKDVDRRADIWSLGVILYQLIVGQAPFQGDTIGEIISQILLVPPTPLGKLRSDVPPLLTAAVQQCLERDPKDRYATVADLAGDLAPHGSAEATRSLERIHDILDVEGGDRPTRPEIEEPDQWLTPSASEHAQDAITAEAERSQGTVGTWEHRGAQSTGSRNWLWGLGLVAALVVGGVGAWILRGPSASDRDPAASPEQRSSTAAPIAQAPSSSASATTTSAGRPSAPTTTPPVHSTPPSTPPSPARPAPPAGSDPPATTPPVVAPQPPPVVQPTPSPPSGSDPLEHSD